MIPNLIRLCRSQALLQVNRKMLDNRRMKIYYRSGALKPMPVVSTFGGFGVFCVVMPGLLIGAFISKNIAAFLEENDLFIPSDDDDDD